MSTRKSHNFDMNVIAKNLAELAADDLSDDDLDLDYDSEEEIELDEREKKSAPPSGVSEKRPSSSLEAMMLGIDLSKEDKEKSMLVQPTRASTKKENDSLGKLDNLLSQSSHRKTSASGGASVASSTADSTARRGKRPDKPSIEDIIKQPAHPVPPVSPGRRPQQQRASGGTAVGTAVRRKPTAMQQHRGHHSERSGSMSMKSDDGKADDPIPRGSGHGRRARRRSNDSDEPEEQEEGAEASDGRGRGGRLRGKSVNPDEGAEPSDGGPGRGRRARGKSVNPDEGAEAADGGRGRGGRVRGKSVTDRNEEGGGRRVRGKSVNDRNEDGGGRRVRGKSVTDRNPEEGAEGAEGRRRPQLVKGRSTTDRAANREAREARRASGAAPKRQRSLTDRRRPQPGAGPSQQPAELDTSKLSGEGTVKW